MEAIEKVLEALEECGEAAAFYKDDRIVEANGRFAALFDRERDECRDLPVMNICHEDSMEMVRDYMRRRRFGDVSVPRTYSASFVSDEDTKMDLQVTVVETGNTGGAYLTILAATGSA